MSVAELADFDPLLDASIRQILAEHNVPGAVVAVAFGERDFLLAHGVKRVGSSAPVTPHTAFDVGSCSKSFVSAAVGLLVDEGKLNFDDPVRRHLPELEFDDPWITHNITIRDLLANRTGLARTRPVEAFPNSEIDVLSILQRVRHMRRIRPFRGGYVYFNIGFMACRLIVERVSGLSYVDFLATRLFAPLGMTDTAAGGRAYVDLVDRATGHTARDGPTVSIADQVFDNTLGAGCLHSSGVDVLKWLRLHLAETGERTALLSTATLRELHRPHTIMPLEETNLAHRPPEARLAAYCLGWWTSHLREHRIVQHAGGMFGWHVQESLVPEAGLGVMVMLNVYKELHQALSYLVQEAFLGLPRRDWTAIVAAESAAVRQGTATAVARAYPVPAGADRRTLDEYGGLYDDPAAGPVEIEVVGERLLMKQIDGRLWDCWLSPLGADTFETTFALPYIRDYSPTPIRSIFKAQGGHITTFENGTTTYRRRES